MKKTILVLFLAHWDKVWKNLCYTPRDGIGVLTRLKFLFEVLYFSYYLFQSSKILQGLCIWIYLWTSIQWKGLGGTIIQVYPWPVLHMLTDHGPTHFFMNNSCSISIVSFTFSWRKSSQAHLCIHMHLSTMACFHNVIHIFQKPSFAFSSVNQEW